jgi:hypothetical protein
MPVQKGWSKAKKTVVAVLGGLGLTGAMVWSGAREVAMNAERAMIRPYICRQVEKTFDSLHAPYDNLMRSMQYDIRQLCIITELSTDPEVLRRAVLKMSDTVSIWKVR